MTVAETSALPPGPTAESDVVSARQPIGHRVARPQTVVRAEPSRRSPRRGRIGARMPFAIYSVEPGPGCDGEGWAAVDAGGFVCLERTVVTDEPPRIQPELPEGQLLPFIYARPRVLDRRTGAIAQVPRYRHFLDIVHGKAPVDVLGADRYYTFVEVRKRRREFYLIDEHERAVPVREVTLARESTFAGRELSADPVPDGLRAAWSVGRPALLRAQPDRGAPVVGSVPYHAAMTVDPRPIAVGEESWYRVPDAVAPGGGAYVVHEDMNYWIPGPELADVAGDEIWIDVELGQQTLAVMKGREPTFVTLISSGAGGTATPPGLFRIYEKLAVSTMKSAPNSEDPYYVEGVPWVQYFHRRYALHASYWHDAFGKRRSHGCINLSPHDAAKLFSLTSPVLPPGWNARVEHPGALGTLVRVRRGIEPVPDLRRPLGVVAGDDEPSEEPESEDIDAGDSARD